MLLLSWVAPQVVHSRAWVLLGFVALLTVLSNRLTQQGVNKPDSLLGWYFGSMGLRMLLSLGLMAWFLMQRVERPYLFIANFFALYLLSVGFEIWGLLANLRRNSP